MYRLARNVLAPFVGKYTYDELLVMSDFDAGHYLREYPDVGAADVDPLKHYMRKGWREGRNPNAWFNTTAYLLCNSDVFCSGLNPLYHFVRFGRDENRNGSTANDAVKRLLGCEIFAAAQDISFPKRYTDAEKLMVILVPEHATMSGGIYSMFSITGIARRLKPDHGYEVLVMTRPNCGGLTYCRQQNFCNAEDVYRFEQIVRCTGARELYLHIPEYTTREFVELLSENVREYLLGLDELYINILNQNIELMPEASEFASLRSLTDEVTQSVAHHAYHSQEIANRYGLPTMLLPAYTDLSTYPASGFGDKEDLIIYSCDEAPHKERCLELLRAELPDYELVEIEEITFDEYMELATRCRFSISFGEGFDGYVAQPVHQGGIGLTVYNDNFFPSESFKQYDNFFDSEYEMLKNICGVIRCYGSDEQAYVSLNEALVAEYDRLYQYDDYIDSIARLIRREFDILPSVQGLATSTAGR